jgi:nucleoside-diphosphate-sugar epimerase
VNLPKTEDAYALGKRAAEGLCSLYHREHQLSIKIARCFAFVGPYLPLDIHFAIGNFIRDALSGQSIIIKGSGRNVFRSYQYPTDLVIWLLHIMLQGEEGAAYNVGADEAYSILEVAEIVAHACASNLKVEVLGNINNVGVQQHYIPDIEKAKNAFNFGQNVSLEIAIQKTLQWYQAQ